MYPSGLIRDKSFLIRENNRLFIATAQHCANYDFEKYCNSSGVHVSTATGNFKGYCESIIISHETSDFVIFEARFFNSEQVKRNIEFLTLADTVPAGGTALKLIGYPGDEERKGQLTVSEKCSVLKTNHTAMQELTKEDLESLKGKKVTPPTPPNKTITPQKPSPPNPEVELAKKRASDIKNFAVKKLHNCSVYGGNSGGALLIQGTNIVVGMPMTYLRLPVTRKFSESSGIHFETIQSVIEKNRRAFEDYKITTLTVLGIPL